MRNAHTGWLARLLLSFGMIAATLFGGPASAAQGVGTVTGSFQFVTRTTKCAEVTGGGTADGTVIQINDCARNGAQSFRIEGLGDGNYRIVNASNGKCLHIYQDSTVDGAVVNQSTCAGQASQAFDIQATTEGFYRIVASNSGRCVSNPGNTNVNGTDLKQYACVTGNAAQEFKIQHVFSGNKALWSQNAFKCMAAQNGGTSNGTNILQATCNHSAPLSFSIVPTGSIGNYRLVNDNSGKCIEVASPGSDGSDISLNTCSSTSSAQSFDFRMIGSNWYTLYHTSSGRCVEVDGGSTSVGAQIQIWSCNGGTQQRWKVLDSVGYDLSCTPTAPNTGSSYDDVVTRINQFRACVSVAPVARWTAAESCANTQAQYDKTNGVQHGGFNGNICTPGGQGQNECPADASVSSVIGNCMQTMFGEGPNGGHFMIMTNPSYTRAAAGFSTGNPLWAVQNFSN